MDLRLVCRGVVNGWKVSDKSLTSSDSPKNYMVNFRVKHTSALTKLWDLGWPDFDSVTILTTINTSKERSKNFLEMLISSIHMVEQKCCKNWNLYSIIILSKVQKKLRPFSRGDVKKCYYFYSIKIGPSKISQSCQSRGSKNGYFWPTGITLNIDALQLLPRTLVAKNEMSFHSSHG